MVIPGEQDKDRTGQGQDKDKDRAWGGDKGKDGMKKTLEKGNDNGDSLALYYSCGGNDRIPFFFLFSFFLLFFYYNVPLVFCVSESSLIVGTCSLEDSLACLRRAEELWFGTRLGWGGAIGGGSYNITRMSHQLR